MKNKNNTLYCFSPAVMLLTFSVELLLIIYTFIRFKMTGVTRIITMILLFLATFQLAEYNVCGGLGASAATWSRIGYVAITFLPVLGIHLVQKISKRGWGGLTILAYGSAGVWTYLFGFSGRAFSGHICAGNYAIFQLNRNYGFWYFVYYYFWLFVGIWLCMWFARTAKPKIKEALLYQVTGYMVFMLPTAVVNTLKPSTMNGIPSIMCGFAVFYALILVYKILPLVQKSYLPKASLRSKH